MVSKATGSYHTLPFSCVSFRFAPFRSVSLSRFESFHFVTILSHQFSTVWTHARRHRIIVHAHDQSTGRNSASRRRSNHHPLIPHITLHHSSSPPPTHESTEEGPFIATTVPPEVLSQCHDCALFRRRQCQEPAEIRALPLPSSPPCPSAQALKSDASQNGH